MEKYLIIRRTIGIYKNRLAFQVLNEYIWVFPFMPQTHIFPSFLLWCCPVKKWKDSSANLIEFCLLFL